MAGLRHVRHTASRLFDALELRLGARLRRHPSGALRIMAAVGRGRNFLSRRWPSPAEVQRLLPDLAPRQAARVAWEVAGLAACNRHLAAASRHGDGDAVGALPLRAPAGFSRLRPPLILGFVHAGLVEGLGSALGHLAAPVVVLRHGHQRATAPPPLVLVTTEGGEQGRAAAFLQAYASLQGGGFVAAALDVLPGAPGTGLPVSLLGRRLELARGPFALARLTGAPILPLAARRCRGGMEIVAGEPVAAGERAGEMGAAAREGELAGAVAAWFEIYLRGSPGELGLGLLRNLLAEAATEPSAQGDSLQTAER